MTTHVEATTEQAQQPTKEYRWQCEKCGDTVPGLPGKYLKFCGHHPKRKGCNVRLVDETGQVVADSAKDAEHKGIFRKEVSKGNTGERSGAALCCYRSLAPSLIYLRFTIKPEKAKRFPVKPL